MLDQEYHKANYGVYMKQTAPVIEHPVVLVAGMHFACLSFSPAADGTRAADWYRVDLSGVRPACSCADFTYRGVTCKHIEETDRQADALCAAQTAAWQAERIARKAAAQEGRAA